LTKEIVLVDGTAGGASGVGDCPFHLVLAANFVFFTLHALFLAGVRRTSDPRVDVHCSGWLWKLVVWAGCLVGFFFVPNSAIIGYAQVGMMCARPQQPREL
jgi:hypothetical protein